MWRVAVVSLLLAGCSAAQRRADALYQAKDYLAAARAYDEAVAADPENARLISHRDDARARALAELLGDAARSTADRRFLEATQALGRAFALSDEWKRAGAGDAELAVLQRAWLEDFTTRVEREGPLHLGSERALISSTLRHTRFAALLASLETAWAAAASSRCARALETAHTPFLSALAAAYCRAAGREAAAPELPLFSQMPKVENFLRGGSAAWPVVLTKAFIASPWSAKNGTALASMSVSGELGAFLSEEEVARTAHWSARVPYQTTRWVQVPYTTYQTYTYPCGRGTCTGTRPFTQYRSEPRIQTDYRDEPRSKEYDAVESRAELSAQVNLFVDLRPLAKPVGTVLREEKVETAESHDAVVEAELPAQKGHVSSAAEWDQRMRDAAYARLLQALTEHWRDVFCGAPLADAEGAARCAWGGAPSTEALASLGELFHDDVATLTSAPRFGAR